jgi:hypothetical protein
VIDHLDAGHHLVGTGRRVGLAGHRCPPITPVMWIEL